ncbi:TPA: hypothetical protein ACX6QE_003870 [Photobacterium damselae]
MIESFVLDFFKSNQILMFIGIVVLLIGVIALFSYPIYVTFLKIKFRKRKMEIYNVYLQHTPESYKKGLSYEIGGWLLNMSLPSSPIWFYRIVAKLNREQVKEWRNGVKKAFGRDYKYYRWYLYITKIVYIIFIPMVIIVIIDSTILS